MRSYLVSDVRVRGEGVPRGPVSGYYVKKSVGF